MSRTTRQWVQLFAVDHPPGVYRVRCPDCDGGRTRETSMTVTVAEGGAAWKCHRASCSAKAGKIGMERLRGAPLEWNEKRKSKVKPYFGESYLPLQEDIDYFHERFGIDPDLATAWVRRTIPHSTRYGAYLFPIFDLWGRTRGNVVRQPVWKGEPVPPIQPEPGEPKARTWPSSEGPTQSWYMPEKGLDRKIAVIVEDQVSAMAAASAGFTGLALLGTHLNIDRVREIQRYRADVTILALDNDAEGIALQLAQKWGMALPGFRLHLLHEDLKDCPDVYLEIMG